MYPPNCPLALMHSCAGAPHEYDAFCCNELLFVAVLLVQHNRLIQIYLRWTSLSVCLRVRRRACVRHPPESHVGGN